MRTPPERQGWRPVWLLAVIMTLGVPTIISGGCYHDCDDDDDCHYDDDDHNFDDDDHWGARIDRDQDDPYRLVRFVATPSTQQGRHPVARVDAIEGIRFVQPADSTFENGEADFELFTSRLILHNQELLGLPESAGRLWFVEVGFRDGGYIVTWRQEVEISAGVFQPVKGATLVFRFDVVGELRSIANGTWLEPPN